LINDPIIHKKDDFKKGVIDDVYNLFYNETRGVATMGVIEYTL
jgi:hypothetical protein